MTEENTSESYEDNSTEDILKTFEMDFGPATGESTPATTTEPVETKPNDAEAPESETTESTEATPATDPTNSQEPEKKEPETEAPEEKKAPTDAELRTLMTQILQNQQNMANQRKEPESSKEKETKPEEDEDAKVFAPKKFEDYTFTINPKLYEGLFSAEATAEERIHCLQAYASAIATTVHNRVVSDLGSWTKKQFSAVPGAIDYLIAQRESSQNSRQSIRNDFFKAYPTLNKPEFAPLIKATIQTVAKETGARTWNTQMRNLVGNRVQSILRGYAQSYSGAAKQKAPVMTPASAGTKPVVKPQQIDNPNSPEAIFEMFQSEF